MTITRGRTRRGLRADEFLLIGKLTIFEGLRSEEPSLGVYVWCPVCKSTHEHGWLVTDKLRLDAVEHRWPHCSDNDQGFKPFESEGYFIGLDPEQRKENQEVFRAFQVRLRAWRRRNAGNETATGREVNPHE